MCNTALAFNSAKPAISHSGSHRKVLRFVLSSVNNAATHERRSDQKLGFLITPSLIEYLSCIHGCENLVFLSMHLNIKSVSIKNQIRFMICVTVAAFP